MVTVRTGWLILLTLIRLIRLIRLTRHPARAVLDEKAAVPATLLDCNRAVPRNIQQIQAPRLTMLGARTLRVITVQRA